MKEKLELVTSFAELRTGMIVVLRPCLRCGGQHRGMLGGTTDAWGEFPDGSRERSVGFELLPMPGCVGYHYKRRRIVARTVNRGAVFRVIDGLESTTSTERTAELVP